MIGDQTSPGTITHQRYDGELLELAYPTAQVIRALGAPGDSVTVNIGDDFDPNLPPLAAYYMNEAYDTIIDETGRYPLFSQGIHIASGTRLGGGQSFGFDAAQQSQVYGDDFPLLGQANDLGFSIEVKPANGHATDDGELVNLGQGALALEYRDNRYHLSARTSAGTFQAVSGSAMPAVWYRVAVRYSGGQLTLNVNGTEFSVPATGDIDFNWTLNSESLEADADANHDLLLGKNYTGQLNSLKWYNLAGNPLMAFSDGTTTKTVTIGADGFTQLTLQSQGNLHENGSIIGLQRIAVHTDNVLQYASVLSTDAFAQIAGQYAVTLAPGAPPINVAGLTSAGRPGILAQHNIRFSLFNEAHAGVLSFAWETVNWILPLESIGIVMQQLGYLAGIGDGEFEPDEFIIALVDVVTIFPPAKPLKLFTKPLRGLTRGLKETNPKFMRYFAVSLNRAVRKAKKRRL